MTDDLTDKPRTDASAGYHTPQRPGQSGAQEQRRPGPNPHSGHPTGPHAPYDEADTDGFAAVKNVGQNEPEHTETLVRKGLDGENFSIVEGGKTVR